MPGAAPGRELLRPSRWPLRWRLVALVLVLLAAVATVIGVVSTFALRDSLVDGLDEELAQAVVRGDQGTTGSSGAIEGDAPQALGIPGQRVGTVWVDGARAGGVIRVVAGYISETGVRALADDRAQTLLDVPADGVARTVTIGDLGRYRVLARADASTYTVVGLPMAEIDATTARHAVTTVVVTVAGLAVIGLLGTFLVRRELRPLARVAATATAVASTPLARGAVELPARVPEEDINPSSEVGRVGSALNRMLAHVEDALAERHRSETQVRQFVADASHELRTPLASIRGYAELVRRVPDDVPPDVLRAMDRVESEARRMTSLVEDLLLLARLDAGRPLERGPVALASLAADGVTDAHAAGPDHAWRLEVPDFADADADADAGAHADAHAHARADDPAGPDRSVPRRHDQPVVPRLAGGQRLRQGPAREDRAHAAGLLGRQLERGLARAAGGPRHHVRRGRRGQDGRAGRLRHPGP